MKKMQRIVDWWLLWWPFLMMYVLMGIFLVVVGLMMSLESLIMGLLVLLGLFIFALKIVYAMVFSHAE